MNKEQLLVLLKSNKYVNLFSNLYFRWQSEKQYEDINDYLEAVKKEIPSAYKIVKRPFSIYFNTNDGYIVYFKISRNDIEYFSILKKP